MRQALAFVTLISVLCSGCTSGVVPMGKDTYMVSSDGSIFSTEFTLEARCLKKADKFCQKKGEAMVFVSKSGHDASVGVASSCEVIFRAVPTNSPMNTPPELSEERLVH